MKLATIAFVGALVLMLAIVSASLLGYDPQSVGELLTHLREGGVRSHDAETENQQPVVRQIDPTANTVSAESFHGPTGKPTIKGPTGPPPQQ